MISYTVILAYMVSRYIIAKKNIVTVPEQGCDECWLNDVIEKATEN